MKCYRYTYPIDHISSLPLIENTLFLDIDTTGFSRFSTFLTIIGLAWQENGCIIIEQWLNECSLKESEADWLWGLLEEGSLLRAAPKKAQDVFQVTAPFPESKRKHTPSSPPLSVKDRGQKEEAELLIELEKRLTKRDSLPTLIHYNGSTFDLPYLKSKYEQHHLATSLPDCPSIDLYRCAKKYKHFLMPAGLKQKNLEEAFGLFREDTLSGQELIQTYLEGIAKNKKQLLDLYLLHNKEDMEGMVFLQNLLFMDRLFQGDFLIERFEEQPEFSSLFVQITGKFTLKKPLIRELYGIHLHIKANSLFLRIPICSLEAKYFYPDYKNYYYLPLEDRAIHKSVASYVEKSYRKKATKETCYIKKADQFYPLPLPSSKKLRNECLKNCCFLELFFEEYGTSTAYLSSSCPAFQNEEGQRAYLKALLPLFLTDPKD